MLRGYELAHIVGISKTAYVLATLRFLDWRHDLQRTSTKNDPSDSQDPCRRLPRPDRRGMRRLRRLEIRLVRHEDDRHGGPGSETRAVHARERPPGLPRPRPGRRGHDEEPPGPQLSGVQ